MVVALTDISTAPRAAEDVVVGVDVAYAHLELKIPMLAEDKGVAVCHTSTNTPTLITFVGEVTEVGT